MMSNLVKAKCPKCNLMVDANSFLLCYKERKMICQSCFKKRDDPIVKKKVKPETAKRPPGWDKEDDEINRLVQMKKAEIGKVERIKGEKFVRYTCPKCSFKFRFFPLEKRPKYCPYCSKENPIIKLNSLP